MSFHRLIHSSCLVLGAGLVSLLAACSSTPESPSAGRITKVNPYRLHDITTPITSTDPSITFARDNILHGAISAEERLARQGDYFTIFWEVDDRQPATVRLEYRQKNTGLAVKKIEEDVSEGGRSHVTKFALNGADFATNGPVTSWRASLVRGNDTVADYKSYLWE